MTANKKRAFSLWGGVLSLLSVYGLAPLPARAVVTCSTVACTFVTNMGNFTGTCGAGSNNSYCQCSSSGNSQRQSACNE